MRSQEGLKAACPMSSFFAELRRRHVYKVAVAYAVVAWLLIQIATQVFPFFEIPNWAVEMVVAQKRPLDAVSAALQRFVALGDDVSWDVVADHDVAFHRAVFVAAGSSRLLRTFDEVSGELRLLIAQLRPIYASVSDLAHEHQLLFVALGSGRVRPARAAWDEHFNDSERFFSTLIEERAR